MWALFNNYYNFLLSLILLKSRAISTKIINSSEIAFQQIKNIKVPKAKAKNINIFVSSSVYILALSIQIPNPIKPIKIPAQAKKLETLDKNLMAG